MNDFAYVGKELELFAECTLWKQYVRDLLAPHIGERVLEVGAGIGANTATFCPPGVKQWVCLEPDLRQLAHIEGQVARGELPSCCAAVGGFVKNLPESAAFDTILYIDVLEHIEDDAAELCSAAAHLGPGGTLIVLSPAHQFLFSPFDRAIGHFRRYTRSSLARVAPGDLAPLGIRYLDSVGLFASMANRALLRHAMPSRRQLAVWNRLMVPCSRRIDGWLRFRIGKSLIGMWRRSG